MMFREQHGPPPEPGTEFWRVWMAQRRSWVNAKKDMREEAAAVAEQDHGYDPWDVAGAIRALVIE